jgi:hypothetical protein
VPEAVRVHTIADDAGLDAVILGQELAPVLADDEEPVGVENRPPLAFDQRRSGEVVHVVDRPHDDGAARPGAGQRVPVADAAGRPGGDAVLGVEDDRARRAQQAERGLERVDGGEDPLLQRLARWWGRHDRVRQRRRAEQPGGRVADGDEARIDSLGQERLAERERVDETAPGSGGVADEEDGDHDSGFSTRSGRRSARAAAARAARPAVSGTMQPASTSFLR